MKKKEFYEVHQEELAKLSKLEKKMIKKINKMYEKIKNELEKVEYLDRKNNLKEFIIKYGELYTEYHSIREEKIVYKMYKILKNNISFEN